MDYLNRNSSISEAAGLLQRCRLLTMSAGTTNQTWSINDYLVHHSDVRLTQRVIGCGTCSRVEEAKLYGMLCAVKMPHIPEVANNDTTDSDPSPLTEGPQLLGSQNPQSQNPPNIKPDLRGWSLSTYGSQGNVKAKLALRKARSHSFEPGMETSESSLAHTTRLSGSANLDGFSKILKECRMLSTLHHPNIVLFFGVYWLEGDEPQSTPAIIEEMMLLTLREVATSFRLRLSEDLPLAMKLSLLSDTARGLTYLHSHTPSIIHPNLQSHDIMISSAMVAKITDLCNAQYGSTKQQDVLAFGSVATLTVGLTPEELVAFDLGNVTDVESSVIKLITSCFSDVQTRPSMAKVLESLEQFARRVPFQLTQMGTMMTAIREWRHEIKSRSPSQDEPPTKLMPSPSVDELLKEKDRQLVELREQNTELMANKELIERRLAEQEEQLQQYPDDSSEVQLSDLLAELHSVVGWFLLGIHLGLPLSDLQKIRHQFNENVDQCKTEMLISYTKLKDPSWTDIVEAVRRSGEHALASRLARKHEITLPETVEEVSEPTLLPDEASDTETEVKQLVGTIQAKDSQLQSTIEQLQREQATKEQLERELALLKNSLSSIDLQQMGTSFQQDRQKLSQQLFLKERERHYLSLVGMGQQNHKAEKNMHGNEIDLILVEKDIEINRMKAQLKEIEAEYSKEKSRSEELHTKLVALESDLTIKKAHITELEKSKEELHRYLADERQRVDVLLMKVIPPAPPRPATPIPVIKEEPVSATTTQQEPASTTTSQQEPASTATSQQEPASTTTPQQEPVGETTFQLEPINNSKVKSPQPITRPQQSTTQRCCVIF